MDAIMRPCIVIVILLLGVVAIPPVAGQAGQNTFLTVQTSDTVLGRVVSITAAPDAGSYSAMITRNMNVKPAKSGDTLLAGDIITLVPGAFANLQLVDRPDVTMLGGGTSGLAVLISRTGGAPVTTRTTVMVKNYNEHTVTTCDDRAEAGRITFVQGRCYIQRNSRLIPASVGESLLTGDTISADEDAEVTIQIEEKVYNVPGRTRFLITAYCPEPVRSEGLMGDVEGVIETVNKTFGDLWTKLKEMVAGETFVVKVPTATAGVRG